MRPSDPRNKPPSEPADVIETEWGPASVKAAQQIAKEPNMYCDHERFQMHCSICFQKFEADSREEVLKLVLDHEAEPHELKVKEEKKADA